MQVGDDVVAIGNALNLGGPPSVTEGIISATDRSIQAQDVTLDNLIQTDAAINPGNSGGPLLNADGQVVAINTAIIDTAQNIGFAIAIDSIKPLIDEIKQGQGTVTPDTAFLGVSTKDVGSMTPDVLAQYGVKTSDGAFVVDIQPGSAAGVGGLRARRRDHRGRRPADERLPGRDRRGARARGRRRGHGDLRARRRDPVAGGAPRQPGLVHHHDRSGD